MLIDGGVRGKLWPYQTGVYPVAPGVHRVQLRIDTGSSCSDEVPVEVRPDESRTLRTVGRGTSGYLPTKEHPLAWPFPAVLYRRP